MIAFFVYIGKCVLRRVNQDLILVSDSLWEAKLDVVSGFQNVWGKLNLVLALAGWFIAKQDLVLL
jgi:hypothetical protein